MSEHPSHNISDSLFICYGCGRAAGDPLLAEECPTPDAVGIALGESVRQQAHRAIQREFAPKPTIENYKPTDPVKLDFSDDLLWSGAARDL